jgi:DNA-binding transcriptional LysR family regulator
VELRHLRYFLAVADERSFSRAAERLRIAQPPLSQQIRRLEKDLGFPVFERTPKGVRLTPGGEALLDGARAVLAAADDARRSAEAASRGMEGRVSLAFMNSAAYRILPTLLKVFRQAHPGIAVDAREMTIADQMDALIDGRVDAGILRPPIDDARLAAIELAEEPFVVALPTDHRLSTKPRIELPDLQDEALVGYPRGHAAGFRERIDAALRAAGISPRVVQEGTHVHTLCAMVAGGVGAAVVPESAGRLAMHDVAFVPLDAPDLHARTWMAWLAASRMPQLQSLVATAQSTFPIRRERNPAPVRQPA